MANKNLFLWLFRQNSMYAKEDLNKLLEENPITALLTANS